MFMCVAALSATREQQKALRLYFYNIVTLISGSGDNEMTSNNL